MSVFVGYSSILINDQPIDAQWIVDQNLVAQASTYVAPSNDPDPAFDAVATVYTQTNSEQFQGGGGSTSTFRAYFDASDNLLFYEGYVRDSWSADPQDANENLYRYNDSDDQVFSESLMMGYFSRSFVEELDGGGYVQVQESGDNHGFSRNETTYNANNQMVQTVSENDQNGFPERFVENYDSSGNFVDGSREIFFAVGTLDSNRDVVSRTLDPKVVSEFGGSIVATSGAEEQARGDYKVTISNTETFEAPTVSASDPMSGTSGQGGGTTTMTQSVTLFLGSNQSTVLELDASSSESSGTWERVDEVSLEFNSSGIKVSETILQEESENGVVTYSLQETSVLVNGWMEIQERIEIYNGLKTTTAYLNGMPDSVSTAIAIDTSSAADFNATNYADLFAYDIDDLYTGATKAVELENNDGAMTGTGGGKTILLIDNSDAIQGSIELWPMWGYDGQVISGQYSYQFYDSSDNWIGNLSDDGTNFYKSVVTETTKTFDETVGLDETALGVDLNFDGDQTDTSVKFDYDGDGNTDNAAVSVNVRIESGGGGASGQSATDTYEFVYRADDWTLLEGTETRGVTTTEYGPQWVRLSETTTLPNDAVFEEISIDGTTAYRVELDVAGAEAGGYPGMGGGQQTQKAVFIYAADKTTVIERHEIWEWTEDRGEGSTFTSTSISKFDGNGNFIGSSWSDSDGGFSNYSETIETRTFMKDVSGTLTEVTEQVRVQTNESGGPYMGFYASEYLYDPDTWEFYGGYEVMDGRKTLYGPNWQVLDEVRAVDTSNVEFVAVTDSSEVLEPFRTEVTQKIVYDEQTQEFSYGSSSSQDIEYFDANQTLVYLAEKSVWTDAENRSNTNITYYDADNNWMGNSSSDASGWSSTNFRYVDDVTESEVGYDLNNDGDQSDTVRMEVEEGTSSSTGGQSESWTYYYEEGNWSLVYGEQSSNGVLTKYGQHWEVIEQTFDLSGKEKVTTDDGYYVEFSNGVFQDYAMAGGGQSESKRVVYFDTSDQVVKSKEVWRWAEGSYWSESFSLYDADGQWIGGGWEDSDGNYSENSETEIVDGSGNVTGRISEGINKNSGWSDEYYYEYDANWSLVSGWQISNNMKTTYGANWEVVSTEYVVNADDLVEVRDDAGALIGYQVVESGTNDGGGMWGSSSWSRATNLDLDQNIIGSVETWRWEDANGFWSEDTSRYDEDGNWIGSVYESSDGYYSSYSQTTETIDGQTRIVSSGSNKDGDGYSYSYRYVYDESWNLVEGWEINGSVKVVYDSSWNIVGREAVQDDTTEYQEIRNKLDQLIGYRTEDTQSVDSADGATDTSVNVTLYDLDKEITKFIEIDRFEETEGYWSEVRIEYDDTRKMLLMRNEDSDGWFEELEWSYGATSTTESGLRTQDGGVFEWTYVYDSTGALQAGSETFQGITYEYGPNWTFVRKIADVTGLEGLDNVTVLQDSDGAVTGYEIVEAETYTDPLGTYSSSSSSTSSFDDTGAFLGSTETWTWTDSVYGGSSSGVSISNGRDQQTYGHSIDATGQFYAQGDTASLSGEQTIWELTAGPNYLFAGYGVFGSPSDSDPSSGFRFYDEELTVIATGDGGVSETVSYVPSDFFSKLLRSAGWEIPDAVSEATATKFNLPDDYLGFAEELAIVEAFTVFDYEDFLEVATADVTSEKLVVKDDDGAYAMRFTGQINSLVDSGTGKKYVNEANSRFSEVEIFAAKSGGGFEFNDATTLVAQVDNLSIGLTSLENALLEAYQLSETNADATTSFLEVV